MRKFLIFLITIFLSLAMLGCSDAGKLDNEDIVAADDSAAADSDGDESSENSDGLEENNMAEESDISKGIDTSKESDTSKETNKSKESDTSKKINGSTEDNQSKSQTATSEREEESTEKMDSDFYATKITDEIFSRMEGKSYKADCTLPREDLRYLHVLHYDFNGNVAEGELVVNKYIADEVLEIFKELYEAKYPIEKIRLVDEYNAVDESSMADNNSSAFNFRFISYTSKISKHGLGMAIDINPLYNPYVKTVDGVLSVEPANAADYVDRSLDFAYKIDTSDSCYQIFTSHGFEWGGSWKNSKDYQHFEVSTEKIRNWYPNY